jgi:hypothetical protein
MMAKGLLRSRIEWSVIQACLGIERSMGCRYMLMAVATGLIRLHNSFVQHSHVAK